MFWKGYVKDKERQVRGTAATCFPAKGLHAATVDEVIAALKVESVQRDAGVVRAGTRRAPWRSIARGPF